MKHRSFLSCLAAFTLALSTARSVPPVNLGESEALKCEEKIASVRRDVLGKYDDALGELQAALQKAADLESALAVRTERQRVTKERTLFERDYVAEPKSLRALQVQYVTQILEPIVVCVLSAVVIIHGQLPYHRSRPRTVHSRVHRATSSSSARLPGR